jgi:hypothetical protein
MMTQYLAHIIIYPYLVMGGYSTNVNDLDKCHRYIDEPDTTVVLHEKPDPRLVMYGVCLKEYTKTRKEYQDARRESSQLEDQR